MSIGKYVSIASLPLLVACSGRYDLGIEFSIAEGGTTSTQAGGTTGDAGASAVTGGTVSSGGSSVAGSGNTTSAGGSSATGGGLSIGGSATSTGGSVAMGGGTTGGTTGSSGAGATSTGGTAGSTGMPKGGSAGSGVITGGMSGTTGGAVSSGGSNYSGGTGSVGGMSSSGGSTSEGIPGSGNSGCESLSNAPHCAVELTYIASVGFVTSATFWAGCGLNSSMLVGWRPVCTDVQCSSAGICVCHTHVPSGLYLQSNVDTGFGYAVGQRTGSDARAFCPTDYNSATGRCNGTQGIVMNGSYFVNDHQCTVSDAVLNPQGTGENYVVQITC